MSIGMGFALEVARFGAVAFAYIAVLGFLFPGGGTTIAAFLCAIFATFLINALQEAFVPSPDQRAVARALAGVPAAQGKRFAVSGPLLVTGSALTSPFSRSSCVAYRYAIAQPMKSAEIPGTHLAKDFRGFANAPCVVDSEMGPVRLRGLSSVDLNAFDERRLQSDKARARARQYISQTRFQTDPGLSLSRVLPAIRQAFAEIADPPIASQQDYGDPETGVVSTHVFCETVIPEGQIVTAIGSYSAQGPELRPQGVHLLTLLPGDLEAASDQSKPHISVLLIVIAMFVMAHVMLATAIHGGAFD